MMAGLEYLILFYYINAILTGVTCYDLTVLTAVSSASSTSLPAVCEYKCNDK